MSPVERQTSSTLTCPLCGHRETEAMPAGACQYFYDCKGCGAVLKPKAGDCCVFCSYGDVACPPMQAVDGEAAEAAAHDEPGVDKKRSSHHARHD